jgi:hypothetical protein
MPQPEGTPEGGTPCWGAGFLPAVYQGTVFRSGANPIVNLRPPEKAYKLGNRFGLVFLVTTFVEKTAMHARMQSFHTSFQHFRKCGEARDLAHWNLFLPQQVCRPPGRNNVHALPLQRAGKRGDTAFVGNGNESAGDFHRG